MRGGWSMPTVPLLLFLISGKITYTSGKNQGIVIVVVT